MRRSASTRRGIGCRPTATAARTLRNRPVKRNGQPRKSRSGLRESELAHKSATRAADYGARTCPFACLCHPSKSRKWFSSELEHQPTNGRSRSRVLGANLSTTPGEQRQLDPGFSTVKPPEQAEMATNCYQRQEERVTCHAGGRGFESRRSRSLHLAFAGFSVGARGRRERTRR
jgi:hypothetical protein